TGPRGMQYDPAKKAVVWSPSGIQKGEHSVAITISADGYDDLVISDKLTVDYRILQLTQATKFGLFPSERWLWWVGKTGELTCMDPVTKEQKLVPLDMWADGLIEQNGKLYASLGQGVKIAEIDKETLVPLRECDNKWSRILALAPCPDGRSLS